MKALARLCSGLLLLLGGCATLPSAPRPAAQSYAWVRFDANAIAAAEASGLADPAARRPLTINDPVRIASISKLVVALGVMRLVEQGRLDLDVDVSDQLGWRLRNPASPDAPISLRLLLSHRASLRDEIDYALPLGSELRTALADRRAFDRAHPPGSHFHYANLGFPVVATVMERATGERFDLLMKRLVLDPLGLDACFNWPSCSDGAVARAVVLTDAAGAVLRDDLKGKQPACPVVPAIDGSCDWRGYRPGSNGALFSPQGGLRISLRDLAAIGRLLLNQGSHNGSRFLSPASIAALRTAHWRYDGGNGDVEGGFYCSYGLAVQQLAEPGCPDDLFGDGTRAFGHAGEAYGLRSGLWIDPRRGIGVAYFATGVADDAPRGETAYRTIEQWLTRRALGAR